MNGSHSIGEPKLTYNPSSLSSLSVRKPKWIKKQQHKTTQRTHKNTYMHEKVSHRIKSETVMTSITYIVNYCANKQTKNKSLLVIIIIIIQPIHRRVQYASKVAMHRFGAHWDPSFICYYNTYLLKAHIRPTTWAFWVKPVLLGCEFVCSICRFSSHPFQLAHKWIQLMCCLKEIERARVSVRALSFLHFGIPMHGWPFDFLDWGKKNFSIRVPMCFGIEPKTSTLHEHSDQSETERNACLFLERNRVSTTKFKWLVIDGTLIARPHKSD